MFKSIYRITGLSLLTVLLLLPCSVRAENGTGFRFIVSGRMNLGIGGSEDFNLLINKIKESRPDFVLFLGDMVPPIADETQESLWRQFDDAVERLAVPVYTIYGNTFPRGITPAEERLASYEKGFLSRYKNRYYSFTYRNDLFICLDSSSLNLSAHPDDPPSASVTQLQFLKSSLADIRGQEHVFVFLHQAPWTDPDAPWFSAIHPLLTDKADYVFGSHDTPIHVQKIDGISYIASNFYSLNRNAGLDLFFHFLLVEVHDTGVTVQAVPVRPITITFEDGLQEIKKNTPPQHTAFRAQYILTSPIREKLLQPDRILEVLNIKPGMSIADIGAGNGFFTLRLARALKNTGMVFATDVMQDQIDYIAGKAREEKISNITPVLVKRDEYDPFYGKHTFDIMLMCEVMNDLPVTGDYFRKLAPSLKKDTGRLYIINFKNRSPFVDIDFGDCSGVIKTLKREGAEHPVFKRLHVRVRDFILKNDGKPVAPDIQSLLIEDFNRMLLDRTLFKELLNSYSRQWGVLRQSAMPHLSERYEQALVKWLVLHLETGNVLSETKKELSESEREQLHVLNRIVLSRLYGLDKVSFLKGAGLGVIFEEKNTIIRRLSKDGFTFVREHGFLPLYYFLEFKR